mgnify:CR=1 FL=1
MNEKNKKFSSIVLHLRYRCIELKLSLGLDERKTIFRNIVVLNWNSFDSYGYNLKIVAFCCVYGDLSLLLRCLCWDYTFHKNVHIDDWFVPLIKYRNSTLILVASYRNMQAHFFVIQCWFLGESCIICHIWLYGISRSFMERRYTKFTNVSAFIFLLWA